jgi:uroporphyrinogen decarboxylase
MRDLVLRVKSKYPFIPIIGFPREANEFYAPYIRQTGIDALNIDSKIDLDYAKRELQSVKLLQGNLDPGLLLKGGEDMKKQIHLILSKLGPNHIFNLGHGVLPETPPENVADLVRLVKEFQT